MRECLLYYIRKHPQCNKKSAVCFCLSKNKGSYTPLFKVLKQLQEENAIECVKRGKSDLCTIVGGNLLVSIPDDLEKICTKFIEFANAFKEVEGKKLYSNRNYVYSGLKAMQDVKIENRIQILPYEVLEVAKELYITYFESILPSKIQSQKHINLLYDNYCRKKEVMESFLHQNFPINSDLTLLLENRKHEAPLGKLCNIVDICRYIKIENHLDGFLDLLWTRNIETCILLYPLNKYEQAIENKQQDENIQYNVKDIIHEIRSGVNYLI
jgi:hypothetical protein